MNTTRINAVVKLVKHTFMNADFGGKERGKYSMSREHLKDLLGVPRLHDKIIEAFTDACLNHGIAMIDLDSEYGFCEVEYVSKWRKLPSRLCIEYASKLTLEEEERNAKIKAAIATAAVTSVTVPTTDIPHH